MPPTPDRARQPRGDRANKHLFTVWVMNDLRDKIRIASAAAGISQAMYVAELIRRDELDPQGVPLWFEANPTESQEELPLHKTA